MLFNYFKIAWRNLRRNKSYSLINTIGLSIGIASCLLIFLFVQDELSYDRFHEKSDRIYRVFKSFDSDEYKGKTLYTSKLLGPTLQSELAGIASSVRISERWPEVLVEKDNTKYYEENFFFADTTIFEIFDFTLTQGNPETALSRPFTVILSKEMANKFFGEENPMGKSISVQGFWGADQYEVTGIMENTPSNSHISLNFLTSMETLRIKTPNSERSFNSWHHSGGYTYVLLPQGVTAEDLADDLESFTKKHQGEERAKSLEYKLQSITDIHLYSNFELEVEPTSDIRYVYIFSSIGLLILLIAGINYTNLATARSTDRAKEIGIRKTLGVGKSRLIIQFLSESLIFCFIATVIAIFLVKGILPYFNELVGKPLTFNLGSLLNLFLLVVATIIIGLFAGAYPAFMLSRFNPIEALRGASSARKKSNLRKGLVVFQFSITIILIAGTFVIHRQLEHVKNKRLGLAEEHVVSIMADNEFRNNYAAFKDELLTHTSIYSVTNLNPPIPSTSPQKFALQPEGLEGRNVNYYFVGKDFLSTLKIPLIKGRDISEMSSRFQPDSSTNEFVPVLINEAGVKEWGWKDPLGKTFGRFNPTPMVVGVVEDFHYRSLKESIAPLVLFPYEAVRNILIRIKDDRVSESISYISEAWDNFGPGTPLEYTFLNDRYDSLYKAEDRMASVFGGFSLLAIIIACLGLLGMVAHSTEKRAKEIGIRKVLGASIKDIITLLSKDFIKLITLGFLIAIPVAWYSLSHWLKDFAYRTELSLKEFAVAGILVLIIAAISVSWHCLKASTANPVDSIRSE